MRTVLVGLIALLYLAPSTTRAEQRVFLVANDADGYGVDRCLASGEKCGAAAANAYCRTQAFTLAATYHKVGHDDFTGAVTKDASLACQRATCEVVAIVCLR